MAEWTDALEAEVKGKLAKIDELVTGTEKLSKQVQGAELLLQQHKNEIGEARKQFKDALDKVGGIDVDALKKVLANLDKIDETIDRSTSSSQATDRTKEAKTPDELKKLLTPEQMTKADSVWKKLTPEARQALWDSQEEMMKFYRAASELPPSVPDSLLDAAKGGQDDLKPLRDLFAGVKKEANFVPGTRKTAATGFADADQRQREQPQERRLPNGCIPRPDTVKK
jgi:hypothetical protein